MEARNQSRELKVASPVHMFRGSLIAQVSILLASLVAIFLAGGPHHGGMGVFLVVAGLNLLSIQQHRLAPWWLWGWGILFLMAISLAMLPERWLGVPEEWSTLLHGVSNIIPGFISPDQVTGDPKTTFFWILVFAASILTALYLLGCVLSPGQLKFMALLACLGCSLYAILAMVSWTTGWHYPFFDKDPWVQPAFGFFPNRNHTAGFLLTGAIISLGLMRCEINGRKIFGALLAACMFVLLTASLLFFSISRGGLFFLVVGVALWLVGLGRHRSLSLLLLSGIVFLVMGILFFQSGSGLVDRLEGKNPGMINPPINKSGKISTDPRIAIARDTLPMIADHPISGVGLGSYALIYPFYANQSLRDQTWALHAESDWLTLAAEGGIPALLIALVTVGMLCAQIPRLELDAGRMWPLRWAFLAAFFAELLHGLVDVPLHRPELGWWIMILGCVGFSDVSRARGDDIDRVGGVVAQRVQRVTFLVAGLFMILLGGLLMQTEWGSPSAWLPSTSSGEEEKITTLSQRGDPDSVIQAINECQQAISKHPLDHLLYYQFAILSLQLNQDTERAKELFDIERRISPKDPAFVFEQGKVLADADPDAAAAIWNEALRRQLVLDASPNCSIKRAPDLYHSMLDAASAHPALLVQLSNLVAYTTPELRMISYERQECDPSLIAAALADPAFMQQLDAKGRGHLFDLWLQHHGDPHEIANFLTTHPQYDRIAAPMRASLMALSGQGKAACFLLADTFHLKLPDLGMTSIQSADQDVPDDPVGAAGYYIDKGNNAAARRILTDFLNSNPATSSRGKALFLMAVLEMRAESWNAALSDLLGFLHATDQI